MDTLEDIERGKTPKEPIGAALTAVKDDTNVKFSLLKRLVEYQLFDIEREQIQTMKELDIYAENTWALMLYMNLHLLNIDDKQAYSAASHIGRCLGILDLFRKMKYYLINNR